MHTKQYEIMCLAIILLEGQFSDLTLLSFDDSRKESRNFTALEDKKRIEFVSGFS